MQSFFGQPSALPTMFGSPSGPSGAPDISTIMRLLGPGRGAVPSPLRSGGGIAQGGPGSDPSGLASMDEILRLIAQHDGGGAPASPQVPVPSPRPSMPVNTPVNVPQPVNMGVLPTTPPALANPFASVLGNQGGAMRPAPLPVPSQPVDLSMPMGGEMTGGGAASGNPLAAGLSQLINSVRSNSAVNGPSGASPAGISTGGHMSAMGAAPSDVSPKGDGTIDLGGLGKFDLQGFLRSMGPRFMMGR